MVSLNHKMQQLKETVDTTIEQADRAIQDMRSELENEKRDLEARHAAELSKVRLQHEKELQRQKEHIEGRKGVLSQMDDKSLLVDMMIALEGYGSRLDRLENGLDVSSVNARIQEVSSEVAGMVEGISAFLKEQIDDLSSTIILSMDSIDVSQLMDRLSSIESYAYDTRSTVGDINSTVVNINRIADDIHSAVDDIKDSVTNEYRYDSLLHVAKEAQSDAYGARSAAEEARDAAREARDAADSARYTVDSHY